MEEKYVVSMGCELECGVKKYDAFKKVLECAEKNHFLHKLDIGTDGSVDTNARYRGMEIRMFD